MQGFGDFANIDIDKLLKGTEQQFARLEEFQRNLDSYVGRAEDENGMVTVEYDHQGVRELELHPKAMRLGSAELAELIKIALADASADFQNQINSAVGEMFGGEDDSMRLSDPATALNKIKEVEALHDRAFVDVMGQLDRIRRRMEL